jgi:hypothetical protein
MKRLFRRRALAQAPDLHSQYEGLLDTVWRCERRAMLMDRIDAQAAYESRRKHRRRGRP